MPLVTIQFNLPEDDEEMQLALRARAYQQALYRVSQEIFRPARKHGYNHPKLQKLVDDNPDSCEIIGMLEDIFGEILRDECIDVS